MDAVPAKKPGLGRHVVMGVDRYGIRIFGRCMTRQMFGVRGRATIINHAPPVTAGNHCKRVQSRSMASGIYDNADPTTGPSGYRHAQWGVQPRRSTSAALTTGTPRASRRYPLEVATFDAAEQTRPPTDDAELHLIRAVIDPKSRWETPSCSPSSPRSGRCAHIASGGGTPTAWRWLARRADRAHGTSTRCDGLQWFAPNGHRQRGRAETGPRPLTLTSWRRSQSVKAVTAKLLGW